MRGGQERRAATSRPLQTTVNRSAAPLAPRRIQALVSQRSHLCYPSRMRSFTAVIEKDPTTGLFVGYVPGWPGAHSQGETVEELRENLREVVEMLLEDGEPNLEAEFVGTATVRVA